MLIKVTKCFGKSIKDAVKHDGIEHSGYLSFLLMLSIFPFLVFFVASVGFMGNQKLGAILTELILNSEWANFIDALKPRIIEITSNPPQHMLTIAILSAIWTASSIFEAFRTILNRAYRVKTPPSYLFRRLISLLEFICMVIITIFIMLILVFIPNMLALFDTNIGNILPSFAILSTYGENLHFGILLLFTLGVIHMMYYFLPNRKQSIRKTLPGTLLVFISWTLFSSLFKYYLSTVQSINIIYGSIAGIIIALLYFYICSLIFIIGAEFNFHMEKK